MRPPWVLHLQSAEHLHIGNQEGADRQAAPLSADRCADPGARYGRMDEHAHTQPRKVQDAAFQRASRAPRPLTQKSIVRSRTYPG